MKYKKTLLLISIFIIILGLAIIVQAVPSISLENLQITSSLGDAVNPNMVWSGSNYGLVWSDSRKSGEPEIRFTRLNSFGRKVGDELEVSSNLYMTSNYPAIVWAGNMYGVVWSEYGSTGKCYLYFARVNKEGKKYGGITEVTSDSYGTCPNNLSIAWNGLNEYGISWHETRFGSDTTKVFFATIDYSGEKTSKDVLVSDVPNSENSSLDWNGNEYGIVWQSGQSSIYFNRISSDGLLQDTNIKINNSATSTNPSIVWHDFHYGVVWQGYDADDNQQLYFAEIDEEGNKEAEITITSNKEDEYSVDPSIIWGNSEFGIIWKQGNGMVNFTSIDPDNDKKNKVVTIFDNKDQQIFNPNIAAGKYQYAFAWQNTQDGSEIYFSQIAFSDMERIENDKLSLLAFVGIFNNNAWLVVFAAVLVLFVIYRLIKIKKKRFSI